MQVQYNEGAATHIGPGPAGTRQRCPVPVRRRERGARVPVRGKEFPSIALACTGGRLSELAQPEAEQPNIAISS